MPMMDRCGHDSFPAGAAMALVLGLLTAAPPSAAYADPVITFPGGNSEFYSPFSGPATVTFTFDGNGRTTPRSRSASDLRAARRSVRSRCSSTPTARASPRVVQFSWPALSVTIGADLPGGRVSRREPPGKPGRASSCVLPSPSSRERRRTRSCRGSTTGTRTKHGSDSPSPRTLDAEARVFKANSSGKCCGSFDPGRLPREPERRIEPLGLGRPGRGQLRREPTRGEVLRQDLGGRRDGSPRGVQAEEGHDRQDLPDHRDQDQAGHGVPPHDRERHSSAAAIASSTHWAGSSRSIAMGAGCPSSTGGGWAARSGSRAPRS